MALHSAARRNAILSACAFFSTSILPAHAQDTSRPLEWVVGYAPGGGSDTVARSVADSMTKVLKRTIVIVNKPGAATNIAAEYVARTRDTSNVMLTADFATLAANPFLFSKLSYDAEKDLAPVGMIARFPLMLVVGNQVPAKNWSEFLVWAKGQEGGASYASAGVGSPHHLATELLREKTGLKLTHVAYRGAALAMQDVIGGTAPFMMIDTAVGNQFVLSGKVRAIGVASAKRLPTLPSVPTLAEQGVADYEVYAWQGLSVPASTPPAVVATLNSALFEALNSTAVKARFQALGVEAMPGSAAEMARYVKAERQRWGKLIKNNNIHLD